MSFEKGFVRRRFFDVLSHGIQKGSLLVVTPEKKEYLFGDSRVDSPVEWHIHDWSVINKIVSRGDIGLGEAYTEGLWDTSHLQDFYELLINNMSGIERYAYGNIFTRVFFNILNQVVQRNSLKGSVKNIRAHYDVGNEFYKLWLDETMTYSSALFSGQDISLAEAQKNKYQRILDKLSPGLKNILEIGCGWGGFAEEALKRGHSVTGLTLSKEQYQLARNRVPGANILMQDYRHTEGVFDAIVSIEMFEAVGKKYWPAYFKTLKKCLSKTGVALIQTITVDDAVFERYSKSSDYIAQYVFPGSFLSSPSQFKQSAEKAGLLCRETYAFGTDYVMTLNEWRRRFDIELSTIRKMGYSNSFVRGWQLYLDMCAASFSAGRVDVMQVELVHA